MRTSKPQPLCNNWGGGGRSFQLNGYYGFSTSESLKRDYIARFVHTDVTDYQLNSIGQFGIRTEKYFPSIITSHAVLGVGIDYSQGYHDLTYHTIGSQYKTDYTIQNHRTMLSLNHMTWVRGRIVGYLTLQGGISQIIKKYSIEDPIIESLKSSEPVEFAYRVGYGFQYYPAGLWGFSIEGGYGDGTYIRAGMFWWIH